VEPQPKSQVEQEKTPQEQIKVNHKDDGDLIRKKKKIIRGERLRHLMLDQDAKMMSKTQDEKKVYTHIKCFKYGDTGHFASKYPTKLEKKAQTTYERQGNEKQYKSKEEKALTKRNCYLCRERGHMANSCPLGNTPKPISFDANIMLRKNGDGTKIVASKTSRYSY
jgi:hypothetical protein